MDTTLCDELLQEIFHRLPPPSHPTITTVSKRWLHLFRSSLSSLTLHLPTTTNHHLTTFLSHHTYLTSLTITTTNTPTTVNSISRACPSLTRLSLSPTPLSSHHLLTLASSLPLLTSLSVTLSRPLFSLHVFTSFNKLNTLGLTVTGYTSAESTVDQSATSASRLNLQSLSLNGICSTDYQVSYLWNNVCYEKLTRLVFEKCEGLSDVYSFSRFLKGLVNLSEVEMKTCRSIVGLVLFKLSEMNCANLSSLLIYDGGNKEGLLHFIREARCELRELDLRLPLDLVDAHLSEIGARFRKLRVLRLESCSMVTGEGIRGLGLGLGLSDHLEELSLTNCDVIKRQSGVLVDLAQSLRKVKVLDLSYNHMLVDKEFVSMISSYGDLRELKVRGCGRLTDVSLIALCRSCKRLESVDIVFCHGIRAEGVEFIILNCKELRKIQIEEHKLSEDARKWMVNKFIEVQP